MSFRNPIVSLHRTTRLRLNHGRSARLGDVPSSAAALHAWWITTGIAQDAALAPVLLYLHGQRWNLSGHTERIARQCQLGFAILAIDYQGFGRSTAALPSESSVVEDAHAAWKWLLPQIEPARPVYIYGHSLGSAIAVQLAADPEMNTFLLRNS